MGKPWERWGNQEHRSIRAALDHLEDILLECCEEHTRPKPRIEESILITNVGSVQQQEVFPVSVVCTPNDTIQGFVTASDADGDPTPATFTVVGPLTLVAPDPNPPAGTPPTASSYVATAAGLGKGGIVASVVGFPDTTLDVTVQEGPTTTVTFSEPVVTPLGPPAPPAPVA